MSSNRRRPSDQDWEDRKDDIVRMFVADGLSLPKIVERLDAGGFSISKHQLEYRLNTVWNLRKKTRKGGAETAWRYIEHETRKRKREQNKDSDVYLDGQLVNPKKLRKETARYSNQGWSTSFDQAQSPQPPSGHIISVCTPRNAGIRIVWPRNLPWLVSRIQTIQVQPHGFGSHDGDYIQALLPGRSHGASTSDTKSAIESLIPESEEGEAARRADVVLSGRTKEALQEQVKILLFKVSNNLMEDNDTSNPWEHLNPLLNIIELSGLMAKPLQLADDDFTMLAVSEHLFQMCFKALCWRDKESEKERVISLAMWLIKSGQSPNTVIDINGDNTTALQVSLRENMDHLAFSLLDAGAHPDGYFVPSNQVFGASFSWQHPLFYAISSACESGSQSVVERLVEAGASLDWCLASRGPSHVVLLSSIGPLALFIDDVFRTDAMVIALLQFILERATTGPGFATVIPYFAELGIAASEAGRKEVLEVLLGQGVVDVNSTNDIGGTALHAAALEGHVDICRLLLHRGALVESVDTGIPSPLHLACYGHHLEVVQLLHAHGASVRRSLDVTKQSAHEIATRFFRFNGLSGHYEFLLKCRLPLGAAAYDEYNKGWDRGLTDYLLCAGTEIPDSLLFSAIRQNDTGLVSLLLRTRNSWEVWFKIDNLAFSPLQYAMDWHRNRSSVGGLSYFHISPDWGPRVEICMRLLDAGLQPRDGDAARAIKLGSWSLVERLAGLHVSQGSSQVIHYPGGDTFTILEAALLYGHPHITEKALELDPNQYSPGALCAATWAVCKGRTDFGLVTRLLDNRLHWLGNRLSHDYSDELKAVETTSIGLAALYDNQQLLDCLQRSLPPWDVACVPGLGDFLSPQTWRRDCDPYPFWHDHRFGALFNFTTTTEAKHEMFQTFVNSGRRRDRLLTSQLVKQKDVTKLQLLSQHPGGDVLTFPWQEKGLYPIQWAMFSEHAISLVRACIGLGEDVNKKDYYGSTPLRLAVRSGDLETTKLLLGNGADIKPQSPELLSAAIKGGDMETVDFLIEKGADVHCPATDDYGTTALQAACIYGDLGLAKRLIDLGVDINAPGGKHYGWTALEGAARHGRIDFIQLLLSEGAETTGDHRRSYVRAVFLASHEGHRVAVRLLKKHREWTAEDEEMLKHTDKTFDAWKGGWLDMTTRL